MWLETAYMAKLAKSCYTSLMHSANIGVLKNRLSAYLRLVRNGEEVIICDRNVPVARILPIEPADDFDSEEARLIAAGIMTPPLSAAAMDWDAFWALPRPTVSDEAVKEAIEWAKGDR
jgi:prevent-host-death family protein